MQQVDYLIVGSGLTGAVIARQLFDAGLDVLVVERRTHVGGNVHDHLHSSGIRIHTYGPHYFRTNSERVWQFATRFSPFYPFEATVATLVDGQLEAWPITQECLRRLVGEDWKPAFAGRPGNFEEAARSMMPETIYRKFVKDYTEKQWGTSARLLDASLCNRFQIRLDDDRRLTPRAKYQGIPEAGYASWTQSMISGIPCVLNFDFLKRRHEVSARRMLVYTGPIDSYFDYDLGKLAYRGQRRVHHYDAEASYHQPYVQVNNPAHAAGPHVRTIEWKRMMPDFEAAKVRGTVWTQEVPFSPTNSDQYEYPMPDRQNARLYERYRARVDAEENLLVCGRLGEYRYFDMDQAIGRAMILARRLIQASRKRRGRRAVRSS